MMGRTNVCNACDLVGQLFQEISLKLFIKLHFVSYKFNVLIRKVLKELALACGGRGGGTQFKRLETPVDFHLQGILI
jgi:hypothetical protein